MFDISFFEIMIISMVALIVIGPERLPQVARTLGHLMGRCRQFVYSIKTDIHNELRMEELKNMHNSMQETV
ncbi:MAG: twin-arginine translocase subunit TatB, partial [Nitrosomonas sp.]|nr:twin-arginine translocase subunit TatB [Nitrosomonas sp.]